jgi:hypothetical protein
MREIIDCSPFQVFFKIAAFYVFGLSVSKEKASLKAEGYGFLEGAETVAFK